MSMATLANMGVESSVVTTHSVSEKRVYLGLLLLRTCGQTEQQAVSGGCDSGTPTRARERS